MNAATASSVSSAPSLETWRIIAVGAVIVSVIAYAVLSGVWVSTEAAWYQSLTKPSWQPPPWVFGVIWPYNFIVLAAVGSLIAWRAPPSAVAVVLSFLVVSIALALTWAYLFYVPHTLGAAAVALTSAAVATIPIVIVAFQQSWVWGTLLMPYQIWVALAASVSWGYVSQVT
jgi:tryptophan-rich sensory protein